MKSSISSAVCIFSTLTSIRMACMREMFRTTHLTFSKLGELMDRQSKPMAMHNTAPCGVPASSPQIPTILFSA